LFTYTNFGICGPLSKKPKGRGKPRVRMKENEKVEGDWGTLILFNRAITES
jgi:hypothetical protein